MSENNDSRIEKLLKAILGQEVQLEPRESRVERLLYAILTGGSHDEPTLSEMEDILLCILHGERYEGPTSSRINDMLKVKANGGSYDEPRLSRIEELIYEWINGGDISTYTGTLPATLQTVAGFLVGYEIWGNTGGVGNEAIVASLPEPLCGIDTHADELALSTGTFTKRIKKLVLTGSEDWTSFEQSGTTLYRCANSLTGKLAESPVDTMICNCLQAVSSRGGCASTSNSISVYNVQSDSRPVVNVNPMTLSEWTTFIQQQYAAGTPVTIWYVLAEPEISTIPVPSGLTGTIEGYLIQDGTPTPEAPIYPTANGVKQSDGTYSIVYGYKLPITSNDTTTDIYIGNTHLAKDEYVDSSTGKIYKWADITGLSEPLCGIGEYTDSLDLSTGTLTRRIKKLVLTGEENVIESGTNYNLSSVAPQLPISRTALICTRFTAATGTINVGTCRFGGSLSSPNTTIIVNYDNGVGGANAFKQYLAQQYANGTPVTVWYVLAEPEISTIPVPSGLTGTIEGYLIQDGTPTPESPIYPTANGAKQADGTYSIESAYITPTDPPVPLPLIPTAAGETTISYGGAGVQPEKVELKYRK